MKLTARDKMALRALDPLEVEAYLGAKGWRKDADLYGKGSLWLKTVPTGDEIDVVLPLTRELGDYALRMADLLRTLAEVERRSELEVLRDVMTTTSDLVRVRAPSNGADEDDSLPLEHAVSFVKQSRDMILSAACAVLEKRALYAKRKPEQAMEYLREARMGQTEQGSFVLTILSPLPREHKAAQGELLPTESVEPFGRQVIRTLMEALTALDGAARGATMEDMAPFDAAVGRGVSANLCDAVVGLLEVGSGGALDIRVSWSPTRSSQDQAPAKVSLHSDSIPVIEKAARHFRETVPIEDYDVEGFVPRLSRERSAPQGDVTVESVVEGHKRRVVMSLDQETYSHAVRAHDDRLKVKCSGELVNEKTGFRLQNPRDFKVVADDEHGDLSVSVPKLIE